MSTINIHKPYVGSPNLANYRGTTLWMKFTPRSAPCLSIMASSNNRLLIPKYLGTQFFLIGDFMVKSIEISIFSGSITNLVSTPDTTPKSSPNNRRNLRRDAIQCC